MRQDNSRKEVKVVREEKSFKEIMVEQKKQLSGNEQKLGGRSYTPTRSKSVHSNIKTKSFSQQIEKNLQAAKQAKKKIFKGLQFVKLIDNFNQEQRCLQHNHVITLYCLNDKRLLCVYCIYGQNKHRTHKLLPPFEHIEYVAQDVVNLQNNFNNFLYSLQDILANSKQSTEMFKNIMKTYLSKLQSEYIKRKLQLQQLYERQKNYIIQTCQSIIDKSEHIFTEFEEIKFNIWECQARYHLDKRVKLPNMPLETQIELNKTNPKSSNLKQDIKNTPKSPSKVKNKQQPEPMNQSQNPKHQLSTDSEKDLRQIMCKHVILSHIVQEMKHIGPLKIDEKTAQKKMFNKLELKLINHIGQASHNSPINRGTNSNYFPKK